ncbi:MAG: hypothetical protein JWN53_1552, partial [Gemmatimonadetes bacterium]|nr:hypothetical protein [Gemmatimonadota bacterium]
IARFRRGDSTLIAAAFAASDDSLRAPHAAVAAALPDGRVFASAGMDTAAGHALLTVPGEPTVAGVDLLDSTTATLARSRLLFAPRTDGGPMRLSDLLLYRYDEAIPFLLDSVLAHSITGEQVTRQVAVGVYWESYGIESDSALQTAVIVERIDHGFFRSARQRLGFDDPDTPIRIHWQDAPPGGAVSSRALSLDLANLAAGRYRISITLSPAVGAPLTSTREVELSDR